jgi:8-oxo-dGTP pyrophosphatase MutT (NUDIX family)
MPPFTHPDQLADLLAPTLHAKRPLITLEIPRALAQRFDERSIAELKPAAVLVPIIARAGELQVLFTQRSLAMRAHPGQISFPGGGRDAGDVDIVATALREADEEIGLDPRFVRVIGMLDDYPTISNYRITPVVGLVDPSAQVRADGVEATALLEIPLAFVLDAANYRRGTIEREGVEVWFYEIQFGAHRVWGATAGMLNNLREKIVA